MRKFLLLIICMLLLVPSVQGAGTCTLNKDSYQPKETATFECLCTAGNEQNAAGNFLWFNSSGTLLQNTTRSSGSCTSSAFGDSFVFPINANFTGNVTFFTLDSQWQQADDIVNDSYTVTGASVFECLISEPSFKPADIGEINAIEVEISDPITGSPLIDAKCIAILESSFSVPLFSEPYGGADEHRLSSGEGHVVFQHDFGEELWRVNTTYFWEIDCFCLPNASTEDSCIEHNTGQFSGFKHCNTEIAFSTTDIDARQKGEKADYNLPMILIIITSVFLFLILSLVTQTWYLRSVYIVMTFVSLAGGYRFVSQMVDFSTREDFLSAVLVQYQIYLWIFVLLLIAAIILLAFRLIRDLFGGEEGKRKQKEEEMNW